jgi:hypothetical protein
MTTTPPEGTQSAEPTPPALATLDLRGIEETPATTVARVILGAILTIVFGALALGLLVAYVAGGFIPAISDWVELLGDGVLYAAIFAFVIAGVGFELMRRTRKRRIAEAVEARAVLADAQRLAAAEAAKPADPTGAETHL